MAHVSDDTETTENDDSDDVQDVCHLFESYEEGICEFGDVILVAKDGYHPITKLRVSSCVLAMASKPFKALFSKKYAEGQRGNGSTGEVVVKDAPIPLKRLCLLLHHQSPYVNEERTIGTAAMLELALLAEKYDCHDALRLPFDALLAKYERTRWTEWGVCLDHLVTIAYMLDQPVHFRRFCREVVLDFVMLSATDFEARCLQLLPDSLPSLLQLQQAEARQELSARVTGLIDAFARESEKAGCEQLVVKLMGNMRGQRCGLWPLDFTNHSLIHMTTAFERIKVPMVTRSDTSKSSDPRDDWDGWGWPTVKKKKKKKGEIVLDGADQLHALYRDALIDGAAHVRDTCVGACLDCMRGRLCRHSHRLRWSDFGKPEDSDWTGSRTADDDD